MIEIRIRAIGNKVLSVFIAGTDAAARDEIAIILEDAGWRVLSADDGPFEVRNLDRRPTLAIVGLPCGEVAGANTVAAIRDHRDWKDLPIVALAPAGVIDSSFIRAHRIEAVVPWPGPPDALVRAAAAWQPDPAAAAAMATLATTFGNGEIKTLALRLRAQLVQALSALGSGEDPAFAHRVAGMAGTMGFAAASRAWLALSEGQSVDPDDIRLLTRRAIVTIDGFVARG